MTNLEFLSLSLPEQANKCGFSVDEDGVREWFVKLPATERLSLRTDNLERGKMLTISDLGMND